MKRKLEKGITLLIAVILTAAFLAIVTAVSKFSLQDIQSAQAGSKANFAIAATDSALECVLYNDLVKNYFFGNNLNQVECDGASVNAFAAPTPMSGPTRAACGEKTNLSTKCSNRIDRCYNIEAEFEVSPSYKYKANVWMVRVDQNPGAVASQRCILTNEDTTYPDQVIIKSTGYNTLDSTSSNRIERSLQVRYPLPGT